MWYFHVCVQCLLPSVLYTYVRVILVLLLVASIAQLQWWNLPDSSPGSHPVFRITASYMHITALSDSSIHTHHLNEVHTYLYIRTDCRPVGRVHTTHTMYSGTNGHVGAGVLPASDKTHFESASANRPPPTDRCVCTKKELANGNSCSKKTHQIGATTHYWWLCI